MTDREPDDLYDALRDRLADYGQEPPAPLWAGIRAQLPPVAGPQKRRRRWAPVVLLLLVLAAAGGVGWHRWPAPPLAGTAPSGPVSTNTHKNENPTRNASPQTQPTASPTATAHQPNTLTEPQPATATTAVLTETSASPSSGNAPGSAITEPVIYPKSTTTQAAKALAFATKPGATGTSSTVRSGLLAGASGRVAGRRIGGRALKETTEPQAAATSPLAGRAASSFSKPLRARKAVAYSNKRRAARRRAGADSGSGSMAIVTGAGARRPHPNAFKGRPSARLSTESAVIYKANKLESPLMAAGLARQAARLVALRLADGLGLGTPRLVAVAPDVPPAALGPHWAVQVLAGPAFTYRQLGASPLNSTSSNPLYRGVSGVAELERPALASGAQVSIRRSFAGPWSLSVGLGYAEFATRLALQQVKLSGGSLDSITGIHRRDTYRFVTLPVRLGYAWPLANRWQIGVLAGIDAALYVGGTSTEGSACACQTQTWGPTGSPYRSLSLGLSLGGEVRYRLNGRWELLAQPTATYLLTPLARPTAGYYQRRLFGGTALLGAAYILP